MKKPDSLIFDMDGTLWDALDSYAECWIEAFHVMGIDKPFSRHDLVSYVGMEIAEIINSIFPDMCLSEKTMLQKTLYELERRVLAEKGGVLYEGVKEGIAELSQKYKVLLLSNCEKDGLNVFMRFADIESYVTDSLTYGQNPVPKGKNMLLLKQRNRLLNPVYIGDTNGDSIQSSLAGMPFIYARYGFGNTENYELAFDDFVSIKNYFLSLK